MVVIIRASRATLERIDHYRGEHALLAGIAAHRLPFRALLGGAVLVGLDEVARAGAHDSLPVRNGPAVSVGFEGVMLVIPAFKLRVQIDGLLKRVPKLAAKGGITRLPNPLMHTLKPFAYLALRRHCLTSLYQMFVPKLVFSFLTTSALKVLSSSVNSNKSFVRISPIIKGQATLIDVAMTSPLVE